MLLNLTNPTAFPLFVIGGAFFAKEDAFRTFTERKKNCLNFLWIWDETVQCALCTALYNLITHNDNEQKACPMPTLWIQQPRRCHIASSQSDIGNPCPVCQQIKLSKYVIYKIPFSLYLCSIRFSPILIRKHLQLQIKESCHVHHNPIGLTTCNYMGYCQS